MTILGRLPRNAPRAVGGRPASRPYAVLLAVLASATLLPAQITFHHEDGKQLVAADAKVERLATGRSFLEGPVWMPDGKLVFSDIPKQQWLTWSAENGLREWKASAGANGNTLGLDGLLISCRHDARNVVRHEADGTLTVLVDRHDGKLLNSPNDVVVHQDGTLWFTDPTYGLGKRDKQQAGNFVYRFDPAATTTTIVQRDFDQPNGLCFSPDHRRLWIADSGSKQRVGAFPVAQDGTLGPATMWLDGGADGMRCDQHGNLYTTARDGVRVYDPAGRHLATIAFPEAPANCAFGGTDGTTLFVTARTSLYCLPLRVAGKRVPPVRPSKAGDGPRDSIR